MGFSDWLDAIDKGAKNVVKDRKIYPPEGKSKYILRSKIRCSFEILSRMKGSKLKMVNSKILDKAANLGP